MLQLLWRPVAHCTSKLLRHCYSIYCANMSVKHGQDAVETAFAVHYSCDMGSGNTLCFSDRPIFVQGISPMQVTVFHTSQMYRMTLSQSWTTCPQFLKQVNASPYSSEGLSISGCSARSGSPFPCSCEHPIFRV